MTAIPMIHTVYDTMRDLSILTEDLIFGEHFIPKGFPTDFTTTRWYIRWLIPRFGRGNLAAITHDYYYTSRAMSRKQADIYYREILIACGFSKLNAYLRFYGVRLLGKGHYNEIGES